METLDTSGYPSRDGAHTIPEKTVSADELRDLLEELIFSSRDLNVRVWLDGVYTDMDNTEVRGDWMNGREVYFKVEGKIDRMERRNRR